VAWLALQKEDRAALQQGRTYNTRHDPPRFAESDERTPRRGRALDTRSHRPLARPGAGWPGLF
jgi:hypothetical protein